MPPGPPPPLSAAERRARRGRVVRTARQLGVVGRIEYRHVYSQTGGAQYGLATTPEDDLLTVYAEAFDRDASPDDFSLEAIVAHERGSCWPGPRASRAGWPVASPGPARKSCPRS